jgi:CheY-like chemotaxis protein
VERDVRPHPHAPEASALAAATPPAPGGIVLIADDEATVRYLAAYALGGAGIPAALARDGDDALEQFRAAPERFGLVLLDAAMPGPGVERVLAGLRALRRSCR